MLFCARGIPHRGAALYMSISIHLTRACGPTRMRKAQEALRNSPYKYTQIYHSALNDETIISISNLKTPTNSTEPFYKCVSVTHSDLLTLDDYHRFADLAQKKALTFDELRCEIYAAYKNSHQLACSVDLRQFQEEDFNEHFAVLNSIIDPNKQTQAQQELEPTNLTYAQAISLSFLISDLSFKRIIGPVKTAIDRSRERVYGLRIMDLDVNNNIATNWLKKVPTKFTLERDSSTALCFAPDEARGFMGYTIFDSTAGVPKFLPAVFVEPTSFASLAQTIHETYNIAKKLNMKEKHADEYIPKVKTAHTNIIKTDIKARTKVRQSVPPKCSV